MLTDPNIGLTTNEYKSLIQQHGLNQLPTVKPPSKIAIFISQFTNPLIYILAVAGLITLGLGDVTEAIGIFMVVITNGILGFIQENKAEDTLVALQQTIKPHCRVVRDGKEQTILSSQLTVGDLIILKLGDKIPADGMLVSSSDFSTNEAILTGESEAVPKNQVNYKGDQLPPIEKIADEYKVFMGTSTMSGYGKIQVTAIGTGTKFGQIADSIFSQERSPTPLQQRINRLSRTLTILVIALSVFMVVYGSLNGLEFTEILELSISVAVSTIPEGLVIALTVILALGMNRILKRKAVVRKLVSAETLGSVDVICVDKTGTLTEGKMKVASTFFGDNELALRAAVATNHKLNSVDIALSNWIDHKLTARQRVDFITEKYLDFRIFNSKNKYAATLGEENIYVLGAPDVLIDNSTLTKEQKEHWNNQILDLSSQGMRLVGVAYKPRPKDQQKLETLLPKDLVWLGLVTLEDPIRDNLLKVFKQTEAAGISIKVITGDYGETAKTVLSKIGIPVKDKYTVSGAELAQMSEHQLKARIDSIKLFYRTTPDQKLRIVSALQSLGHTVAMMGDGINDTPALKKAEIGIVVENATDFSKEVADMVLLDSNFNTIIAAVEEGRGIFENMRKVITYLLVDSLDALVLVLGALLLNLPTPLLPLQILYINFIADGLPDVALAFEKPEHEVMRDKPKAKDYPLLDSEVKAMILIIGLIVSTAILLIYVYLLQHDYDIDMLRTIVFLLLGIDSLFYVFSIRSFRKSIWQQSLFSNKLLLVGVAFGFLSMVAAVYLPPLQQLLGTKSVPYEGWLLVIANTLISIILIEIIKSWYNNHKN